MPEMKTHQTAVVLIPPLELWEPIQQIRRRYDRQFKRWMPHITLLYPFRPEAMFAEIGGALEKRCATIDPFEIELVPVRFFEHNHRSYTMWLSPEPSERVIRLQAMLLECAPDCNDVNLYATSFLPHLSVGQARNRDELEERMERIRTSLAPIRFTATDVAMIRRGPGPSDPFQVDRLIPLGRASENAQTRPSHR